MFTGIIEATGIITDVIHKGSNIDFWLQSPITHELKIDQSVAHNGVCLTVVGVEDDIYKVTAVAETLQKTSLDTWKAGDIVNLERSLKLGERLDGHLVQGHADATATCIAKETLDGSWLYTFQYPEQFAALIIEKGSACINGVSLTVFNITNTELTVTIIPYTYSHTNFKQIEQDTVVNIEFDVLGKYLLRPTGTDYRPGNKQGCHILFVITNFKVSVTPRCYFLMQKPEIKPFYDVAVIGAGVGGLTAAAILSKAGLRVCVLDKEPHPGGYLAGFRRKNFRFDTAIHWLNQLNESGMATKIFDILGSDHPKAVSQTRIKRYKGDTYDYLLTNNPDELRDQLISEYPHEKNGLIRFFKAAKKLGSSFNNFSQVFRTEETMNFVERMKNKIPLIKFVIPFLPYITYSGEKGFKKGLNKFFKDEGIHKLFTADSEILGCLVPIGWAYYGDFQSPPVGGGQVIPEWLEHVVKYYNNDIFYKANVKQVLLDGNMATGVSFEHFGTAYEVKSKYVIAACDVETLYEKMLPPQAISQKMKDRLKDAELYSSSITVSIALDCTPDKLGFNEEMVHVIAEDTPKDHHADGNPATSEISILAPSFRDPTLAPEGQGTLTLYMPAFMHYNDEWLTQKDKDGKYLRGDAYKKLKNEVAEILIKRVEEKVAPGLRSHILFYDVATPVTHWRYTGNRNGSMMGAKPGKKNMQSHIAHYQTPVKRLLLGGHWAELGGGVPIAVKAGGNAALLVLQQENKAAFNVLASYMDGKIDAATVISSPCFKQYDNSWMQAPTPAQKYAARMQEQAD